MASSLAARQFDLALRNLRAEADADLERRIAELTEQIARDLTYLNDLLDQRRRNAEGWR